MDDLTDTHRSVSAALDIDIAELKIAVIIPCYNEAVAIATVVTDFQKFLPTATIYVYDNNSRDDTVSRALAAGAVVRSEPRQGKGYVVRRMFADIEADLYVLIDGDDTYDVTVVHQLVDKLVRENLDMVNGARVAQEATAYRRGHNFGNRLLTRLVQIIFGSEFNDMLSGYRVFSRRFVKSFPQSSGGFEIETELTIHALELQMPTAEVGVAFKDRGEGSESKLNTFSDGIRILWTIANLLKQERPMSTFSAIGALLLVLAGLLSYPIFVTFFETGLVPRFPTAILATGISVLAFLSFTAGLILDTVTRGRQEAKRMRYLEIPSMLSILGRHNDGND
jgi:glycosyltransferase involved in cell wall biosynthesis